MKNPRRPNSRTSITRSGDDAGTKTLVRTGSKYDRDIQKSANASESYQKGKIGRTSSVLGGQTYLSEKVKEAAKASDSGKAAPYVRPRMPKK